MRQAASTIFVPFIGAFGGVERLILGLSQFLHQQGRAHTVTCFADTIGFPTYATWPMSVVQLRPARNALAEGWSLKRYLDAAHRRGAPAPLLFDLKGAFYAGLFTMPPYHLHLTDPPSLLPVETSNRAFSLNPGLRPGRAAGVAAAAQGEVVHRINKRGAARARTVLAMSDAIAGELRRIYAVAPRIVRPGVDAPPHAACRREQAGGRRALSVSRLEPNKRIDWILRSWARLAASDAAGEGVFGWHLDVVGDGSQRGQLEALAASLGLDARVTFHGRVSDAGLDALLGAADLFLMPAAQGYGLPALEALARGVPVVLHRESGVSEILGGTLWAAIVDNGLDELTREIRTMVDRIDSGAIAGAVPPMIPTATEWSRNISEVCGWL